MIYPPPTLYFLQSVNEMAPHRWGGVGRLPYAVDGDRGARFPQHLPVSLRFAAHGECKLLVNELVPQTLVNELPLQLGAALG